MARFPSLSVQPVRDTDYLYRANVLGSKAVLPAITAARVETTSVERIAGSFIEINGSERNCE